MTPGSDLRPTRRLLTGSDGKEYVVELRSGLILIREKGRRRGGSGEVALPVGAVYVRGILSRIEAERREKRKGKKTRVTRGWKA